MIMVSSGPVDLAGRAAVAVVVTVAKGYDLGYVWKTKARRNSPRKAPAGITSTPPSAVSPRVAGGGRERKPSGSPMGRWWSGDRMTRYTSSVTRLLNCLSG
jgi:hypothetical protein